LPCANCKRAICGWILAGQDTVIPTGLSLILLVSHLLNTGELLKDKLLLILISLDGLKSGNPGHVSLSNASINLVSLILIIPKLPAMMTFYFDKNLNNSSFSRSLTFSGSDIIIPPLWASLFLTF